MADRDAPPEGVQRPAANLDVFGFRPTPAQVEVIPRSRKWRLSHALMALAIGWGCIPVVMFIPPHFPWVLTAFGCGIGFCWKFWHEEYTLVSLKGQCPKCGAPQEVDKPVRMKSPHVLSCKACHQNVLLNVDKEHMEAAA